MSFTKSDTENTLQSLGACTVVADSNELVHTLWFRTPALDETLIKRINKIQLQTSGHDQGFVDFPGAGSWSWFDIVVLESPEHSEPKIKDGLTLLWLSHTNSLGQPEDSTVTGPIFDRSHDIFKALEPGNSIAVRVCARFSGWENNATSGTLTLHLTKKQNDLPVADAEKAALLQSLSEEKAKFTDVFDTYLNEATPPEAPPAYSLVRTMLLPGPIRADQTQAIDDIPLQLLSLDGGGVRGISSLYILQAIMKKLTGDPKAKPADYFHMIAGTSTGGLIAIMLGRLRMTIEECIEAYMSIAADIFSATTAEKAFNVMKTGVKYKADKMEKVLKAFIKRRTGDENAPLLDLSNRCKVFVVAVNSQDLTDQADHFRSYQSRLPDKYANVKIWEAARATSAAPFYFPSITLQDTEFIDGGFSFNNPSMLLLAEASVEYGYVRPNGCFLTIGTGMKPKKSLERRPKNILDVPEYVGSIGLAALKVIGDCERTHQLMKTLLPPDIYWRFNVGIRVGDDWKPLIDLDEYQKMPELVKLTRDYLAKPEEVADVDKCTSRLRQLGNKP
ncbi:hypothetical protein ONZ45_g14017 [Pleurotus djamor]|nr:hypothetical protein ONZ45_g14017 [Pleurotus djamor]